MRRFALTVAALLAAPGLASAAADNDATPFARHVENYYAESMRVYPTSATELGIHDHDGELEDFTAKGVEYQIDRLRLWNKNWEQIAKRRLSPTEADDVELIRLGIAQRRNELEDLEHWRRLPDFYPNLASRSIYVLIKRDFAPVADRMRAVIARERKIPALLAAGQKNLDRVSRVAVDIALDEIDGIRDFFTKDVPLAFKDVHDPALRSQFDAATKATTGALVAYREFLRKELAPHANAPIAIGEAQFVKKLAADEQITTPLDALLKRGEAELARLQAEFRAAAARVDAKKTPAAAQEEMQKDHPPADRVIAETQARLVALRKFLVERDLVGLPSEVMPRVEETPPFMRATTLASMETPGPFERRATEAYYNVTLPEATWTAAQAEDFLRGAFARASVDVTSIHEAFPGHYVQFLWVPKLASVVRRYESVNTNVEGWAHYCEQMMLDEGWGRGDARLRLAQVQDALLRAARYVVGIRMHARGMTFEQAVDFFVTQGMQSRKVAEMEARRGTEDPTYLYYTLGKLEILRMRDDYKKKLGAAYTLRKFHDAFLHEGPIPLPMMRRALGLD
jgi:uncharacterized protein (DUF885 family)